MNVLTLGVPPPLPIALLFILLVFAVLWLGVSSFLALSGWRKLAKNYRWVAFAGHKEGQTLLWESVIVKPLGFYNHMITASVSRHGFGMKIFPALRWGHPPLFFRWSEVRYLRTEEAYSGTWFLYDLGYPRLKRVAVSPGIHRALQLHLTGTGYWPTHPESSER